VSTLDRPTPPAPVEHRGAADSGRPILAGVEGVPSIDVTGWVLRLGAAALFVGVGLSKFEADTHWVGLFAAIGLGDGFRYLTGVLQTAGGLLFLVPRARWPAAVLTGATMVGAVGAHLFVLDTGFGGAIIPAVVLVFVACVVSHRRN
jgi:putative oxidoreductase